MSIEVPAYIKPPTIPQEIVTEVGQIVPEISEQFKTSDPTGVAERISPDQENAFWIEDRPEQLSKWIKLTAGKLGFTETTFKIAFAYEGVHYGIPPQMLLGNDINISLFDGDQHGFNKNTAQKLQRIIQITSPENYFGSDIRGSGYGWLTHQQLYYSAVNVVKPRIKDQDISEEWLKQLPSEMDPLISVYEAYVRFHQTLLDLTDLPQDEKTKILQEKIENIEKNIRLYAATPHGEIIWVQEEPVVQAVARANNIDAKRFVDEVLVPLQKNTQVIVNEGNLDGFDRSWKALYTNAKVRPYDMEAALAQNDISYVRKLTTFKFKNSLVAVIPFFHAEELYGLSPEELAQEVKTISEKVNQARYFKIPVFLNGHSALFGETHKLNDSNFSLGGSNLKTARTGERLIAIFKPNEAYHGHHHFSRISPDGNAVDNNWHIAAKWGDSNQYVTQGEQIDTDHQTVVVYTPLHSVGVKIIPQSQKSSGDIYVGPQVY